MKKLSLDRFYIIIVYMLTIGIALLLFSSYLVQAGNSEATVSGTEAIVSSYGTQGISVMNWRVTLAFFLPMVAVQIILLVYLFITRKSVWKILAALTLIIAFTYSIVVFARGANYISANVMSANLLDPEHPFALYKLGVAPSLGIVFSAIGVVLSAGVIISQFKRL